MPRGSQREIDKLLRAYAADHPANGPQEVDGDEVIAIKMSWWQAVPLSVLTFFALGTVYLVGMLGVLYQVIQKADEYMNDHYPIPTAVVIGYAFGKWITWGS